MVVAKRISTFVILMFVWIYLLDLIEYWLGSQAVLGMLAALGSFTVGVLFMRLVEWLYEDKEEINEI